MHKLAAERRELCDEEGVKAIDVLAAARAEAQVVQAWLVLVVAGARVLRPGGADRQPSLAADEVEDPALGGVAFQIVLAVHLKVLAQRAIERTAARQIRDRELHVGDPCELHGRTIASARCHGKGSRLADRGRSYSDATKALGLNVPNTPIGRADEVIE